MIKLIFTVYDSAAQAFLSTFEARTIEEATRMFRVTVNNPESQIHKFPEDYTLFLVGEFDQSTGILTGLATPQNLGIAVTYFNAE